MHHWCFIVLLLDSLFLCQVVDASQLWVKEAPGVDMSSEAEQFHKLSMEIQQLCGDDLAEVEAVTNPVRGQVGSYHPCLTKLLFSH